MTDIIYDHFLACDWDSYHIEHLQTFSDTTFKKLLAHREHCPDNAIQSCEHMFENNEKYTIKRTVLENALKDNEELAGKARLHEFKRKDSAMKAGVIGVPSRSSRIGVLLGYVCTYPNMEELAGDMFHGQQKSNPNIQGQFPNGTTGGL